MITLHINGQAHELDVDPATPLLWAIREHTGLTGKTGLRVGQRVRTQSVERPGRESRGP